MSPSKVQIYIMSRNRPSYLLGALESCLAQTHSGVEVIVSDNSDGDEVVHLLQSRYPAVCCRSRKPVVSAIDHFNMILSEVDAPFFVIFHDDDVLDPHYVSSLIPVFSSQPELAAIACDANIIREEVRATRKMANVGRQRIEIKASADFLSYYFGFSSVKPTPFPAYMYKKEMLTNVVLDRSRGGKYSDVSFLLNVLQRGNILWLPQPLMHYRIHASNDSATEAVGQRMSLLRFVYRNGHLKRSDSLVTDYRFKYWVSWYRQKKQSSAFPWRKRVVRTFLVWQGLKLVLTRPSFWVRVLGRLK